MNSLQSNDLSDCYYKYAGFYYPIKDLASVYYSTICDKYLDECSNNIIDNIWQFDPIILPTSSSLKKLSFFLPTLDEEVVELGKTMLQNYVSKTKYDINDLIFLSSGLYYDFTNLNVYVLEHLCRVINARKRNVIFIKKHPVL